MNVFKGIQEKTGGRFLVILVAAGLAGFVIGGPVGAIWAIAAAGLSPGVIGAAAFFWTSTAEWTKLGVAELYGVAAQKQMEKSALGSLRDTLDPIGQEALDELERAIERRDEGQA